MQAALGNPETHERSDDGGDDAFAHPSVAVLLDTPASLVLVGVDVLRRSGWCFTHSPIVDVCEWWVLLKLMIGDERISRIPRRKPPN